MHHVCTALISSTVLGLASKISVMNVFHEQMFYSSKICKGDLALKEVFGYLIFFFLISVSAGRVSNFENPSQTLK